ncbi:MAG: glycoside hydrolase family 3 C-terminal domain-containing protein [Treponema sp.]|jgi:beta-glucosidase|nr:glycoside hydrolase family 3 C-terminal domain-containing protein [Treponema sp.]
MTYQYPFLNPTLPLKERVKDLISRLTPEEKAGFIPTRNQPVERLGIAAFAFGAEGAHGYVNREGNNTTFPQTIGLAAGWDRNLLRKVGEIAATEARVFHKINERKGGLAIWSPTIDMERDPRWGRTEEGYGEDPFLAGELSSAYIHGAQGDDPFYLRVSCGPKHFFANNNEKDRGSCNCSIPPRVMREYYLAPFKKAIQDAKAVSIMTAYNEVNGIPMMLHPMLNDIVKNEWGIEGNLVTDGGDFLHTVNLHHYFETHAETLAAALKNGADSMTDNFEMVIAAVNEALEKKLITEAEIDEHLERIFAIRFRFGEFDPPGLCPYDKMEESDLMKDEYREIAREAVRKSIVLLKNDNFSGKPMLPLRPQETDGSIAVLGPLADKVHLDWYSGIPTYIHTPLDGLRDLYGKERVITADYRDIVSFTTEDGRPLVLAGTGNPKGKTLAVGAEGHPPARFCKEDWGWGSQTLADVESGLLLESVFWRKEPGGSDIDDEKCFISASGKSSHSWFSYSIFNLVPQESGLLLIRTFDNRRITAPSKPGQIILHDDPAPAAGELFKMKVEHEGLPVAVEAAAKAGQVIFCGGNNPMINGRECTDRPSLNLPPPQEEFLRRVIAVNPKTALVMISGYPFTIKEIAEKTPAIIWMAPGIQETGNGLADVIGGSYSPAGRLPLTWYEDEKQLPSIMEYDIISARTTYQYFKGQVLWAFGYGLSYSSFTYSDLQIDKGKIKVDESVTVSFKVKNSGVVAAEEVPQMYVTARGDPKAPWAGGSAIKRLKGFDRISLAPGEEKTVCFKLEASELALWDSFRGAFFVETSKCTVEIGASSKDIRLTGTFDIDGGVFQPRKIPETIYAERFDDYANCFLHEKRGSGIAAVFANTEKRAQVSSHDISSHGWIRFGSLNFEKGLSHFSAIVQGSLNSSLTSGIEIRLDAPDGKLLAAVDVPNTGEISHYELSPTSPRRRSVWAYVETSFTSIEGAHDLYIVLRGKTGIWRFGFK